MLAHCLAKRKNERQGNGLDLELLLVIVSRDVEKVAQLSFQESLFDTNNKFPVNAKLTVVNGNSIKWCDSPRL
jgi:hypothetical protein